MDDAPPQPSMLDRLAAWRGGPLASALLLLACAAPAAHLFHASTLFGSGNGEQAAETMRVFLAAGLPLWTLAWALVAAMWWRRELPPRSRAALLLLVPAGIVVAGAFAPPSLSDDIFRYVWEGRVVLAGENPYVLAPDDPALRELAARSPDVHPFVNNPQLSAIYPPLAQAIFVLVALLGGGTTLMKLALSVPAALAVALFHRWLAARGLPTGRALALASHPLLLMELGFGGHLEPLLLLGVCAMLLASERGASWRGGAVAGAGLATAILVKLMPVVFLPHLIAALRGKGPRIAALVATPLVVALFYAPFLEARGDLFSTLGTYNKNWEFNGMAHRALVGAWHGLDPAGERIAGAIDALGAIAGTEDLSGRLRASKGYEPIHPAQLAARITAAALFGAAWIAALWVKAPLERRWLWVVGAGLVLSPVCHPWYVLALLPGLFSGGWAAWAGLAWSAAAALAYAVLPGWWAEGTWVLPAWAGWAQVAAMAAGLGAWATTKRRRAAAKPPAGKD